MFGTIASAALIPFRFPNKREAMGVAFKNCLAISVVVGVIGFPWPHWAIGLCAGIVLSVPDALITKAYVPVLTAGVAGGLVLGLLVR